MSKSVLTLGTFDGVHRGHQILIKQVVRRAKALQATSVVLSFDRPPRHTGQPLVKPVLLTTLGEKLQILKHLGIKTIQVLTFDRKTASTSPEDFFQTTVRQKHKTTEMIVGPRVAFGRHRAGKLAFLRRLGKQSAVRVRVVSSVEGAKAAISSRRIRALIAKGHIETANALLGYPYSISGTVVHGDKRGRTLGFPTANIHVPPEKMIPQGVYWVKVFLGDRIPFTSQEIKKGMDGLCNVGIRPTFTPHAHQLHCEVFLLNQAQRLYGQTLRVVFLRRIRAEKRFASPEALQHQIARDVAKGKSLSRLYKKAHFSI